MCNTEVARVFSFAACFVVGAIALSGKAAWAEPVVPGTGIKIEQVGDDFEDPTWDWSHNWPKSTENLNNWQNAPGGEAVNGRWYEGIKRGHPDLIKRVETPNGGLPGSQGSLLLRSLYTGVPRSPSYRQQQDDFICDVKYNLGGALPAHQTPSVVTRVFLPPVNTWENRTGCHFAFRVALDTSIREVSRGFISSSRMKNEIYYPGFFVDFEAKEETEREHDSASIRVRANGSGEDYKAKDIKVTGWWTLGMSVTPDGAVHYYAKQGIEDLTEDDHLTSHYPYGYRCERLRTFFFNVCNGDDGKTWSTEWIVDDPSVYYVPQQ